MDWVRPLCFFIYYPRGRLGARRLRRLCLCGQLKQGGGDSSKPLWGHLRNRLTNASPLCHKDTRLTKMPINVSFTTHLFVTQVFIPAVSCIALSCLTRPGDIFRLSRRTVREELSWTLLQNF